MSDRRALGLLLVPILVYATVLVRGYDGEDYLRGDCPYYYAATISLLKDHDLELSNQVPGGLSRHLDQVSLAKDGRVVPKHPIPMALAALPFVAVLGRAGTLVFNVAQIVALLFLLYALARRVASPAAAGLAAALTGTFSFLPHYVWNFSPDLFATVLLAGGLLALAVEKPSVAWDVAGGALLGLAGAAKPAFMVTLPAALLLPLPAWRRFPAVLAGLAIPIGAWALLNLHLFGAPHVTAYDRIARVGEDGLETYSQRGDFGQPIAKGVKRQLRHPTQGLIATSAITLVSWIGFPWLAGRHRRLAAALALASALLFLFFSTYRLWDSSHHGNRHLMPVVALAALPLAALLDGLLAAFFRRRAVD